MEIRNSFIFYSSFYEAINELPEEDQGPLYKAIIDYALAGISPKNLTGISKGFFALIKPNIDAANARHDANIENGKRGGRPPKEKTETKPNQNPNETQAKTETKPNQNPEYNPTHNPNQNLNIERELDIVSKYVSKKNKINNIVLNNARACESYDEIFNELEVAECVRNALISFIKHCQVNGHVVINDKLQDIIFRLDRAYGKDEQSKIKSIKTAINSGYFDILEGR